MASAAYCGTTGSVSGGTEVFDWTANLDVDNFDIISFSSTDGWVDVLACLKGGNFTYKSYSTPTTTGPASVTLLSKPSGGCSIGGSVIVNKVSTIVDANGVVSYETAGVFNGDIVASGD